MTPVQLQLLLAMARTLKNIEANLLASVGTNEITEALRAVEAEANDPGHYVIPYSAVRFL